MLDQISEFIVAASTSGWSYLWLATFIILDAIVPVFPSESLVISMASVLVHEPKHLLVLLFVVSAVAAWVGDNLAFMIGRSRWLRQNLLLERPKVAAAFGWARKEILARGATVIVVGRFIPGVRIAINMVCGIVGYSQRRFMLVVTASASLWSAYSVVVGVVAGNWFGQHKLLGVLVAVAVGVILGPIIDWLLRKTVFRGSEIPGRGRPGPGSPPGEALPGDSAFGDPDPGS
ncbi:MAG: VTT domain-containing protein [Brooklawnia sp.]|uniref:DedA family protein n=1 Tax=Brooklawnia sp. TaxID=2699740 RepID=UPI003C78B79E